MNEKKKYNASQVNVGDIVAHTSFDCLGVALIVDKQRHINNGILLTIKLLGSSSPPYDKFFMIKDSPNWMFTIISKAKCSVQQLEGTTGGYNDTK